MPTLSNVVSTFKRRINSTGAAHRPQQPDVDYSTDCSADELNQRNHNILKSLPRPRKKSTKTRSDSIPSSPTKDYPSSDQEEQPPELRRWSGFKDPFPKVSPGGYKRYYESHGGVPEPKSSSKPLPPKPSKSSSTGTSAGSTVKATITISQPKAKQGPASRSSGRPNGPHGITAPPSNTSPPRSQKPSHPPKSQSQRYRDAQHEQAQYENAFPPSPTAPSDLTPVELDMITTSLLHGGHGQVYGYNQGYNQGYPPVEYEYEEDLTSTIRLHDEHDLDIEYPEEGYTSDTIYLTYDPPPHNYQKKRLSTIPERPSRSSSLHRLSAMSHVSQTSSIGRSSIIMNPRQRADSTATQGTTGTTHSHTRSNSTGSINSSINTNPSARLRRSQRQVLRTPSLVREFSANEASAPGSGSAYGGGGGSTHASSLHRGPSTSSQTSQLSNASSYAYSYTSSSSPTDTSGGVHSFRSRSGYGSDTPPTTVEDGDENEGLAPLPLPLPPLKKKMDKGKGKAKECDNRREKVREGDGREEKEESGDVFDEAGLEAVARRTATSRVNQRTTGKGRRAGYSAAIVAADVKRRRSREVKRASKEVKDDEWEDEAEEGNEDWRNTWYTAKTHFSDDGR